MSIREEVVNHALNSVPEDQKLMMIKPLEEAAEQGFRHGYLAAVNDYLGSRKTTLSRPLTWISFWRPRLDKGICDFNTKE